MPYTDKPFNDIIIQKQKFTPTFYQSEPFGLIKLIINNTMRSRPSVTLLTGTIHIMTPCKSHNGILLHSNAAVGWLWKFLITDKHNQCRRSLENQKHLLNQTKRFHSQLFWRLSYFTTFQSLFLVVWQSHGQLPREIPYYIINFLCFWEFTHLW